MAGENNTIYMERGFGGKNEKAKVPDEDMLGWIEVLREGGFDDKEIDRMLTHLNQEYAEQKMPKAVRDELERVVKSVEVKKGRKMTPQERKALVEVFLGGKNKK